MVSPHPANDPREPLTSCGFVERVRRVRAREKTRKLTG